MNFIDVTSYCADSYPVVTTTVCNLYIVVQSIHGWSSNVNSRPCKVGNWDLSDF